MNIYNVQYYRHLSNFNPTIPTGNIKDILANPYNYTAYVNNGVIQKTVLTDVNRKFAVYNSDLLVQNINFVELTFVDGSTNALFFGYFSPFKWITATNCQFNL